MGAWTGGLANASEGVARVSVSDYLPGVSVEGNGDGDEAGRSPGEE